MLGSVFTFPKIGLDGSLLCFGWRPKLNSPYFCFGAPGDGRTGFIVYLVPHGLFVLQSIFVKHILQSIFVRKISQTPGVSKWYTRIPINADSNTI